MLSYPIPEAEELLANKLSAAQQSLSNCEEDMDFLREQVTVRYILPFSLTHISMTSFLSARLFIFFFPFPLLSHRVCFQRNGKTDKPSLAPDYGSRHSSRLQLGYWTKAEGGGRCGVKE